MKTLLVSGAGPLRFVAKPPVCPDFLKTTKKTRSFGTVYRE
jgi:hypothetical protein